MQNKKKLFFSIITPVLNGEKYIKKNIKSLKNQSYKNFEHIIVDGGSNDNTLQIISKNKSNKQIILKKKDKNLWQAINKGIKISKGDIIGILNSDDYYYRNALRIIKSYFEKNSKLDFMFGAVKKYNRILYRLERKKILYKFNVCPSHSVSFFIKKKSQKKIGLYNENLNYCSDYDLFYRLFTNKKMVGTHSQKSEVIGYFRPGGISEKLNFFNKLLIEMKIRLKNKQNIFYLIFLFILINLNYLRNILLNYIFKTTKLFR